MKRKNWWIFSLPRVRLPGVRNRNRQISKSANRQMAISFKSRPSLVAYITCGDPDIATTKEIAVSAIDAGADIIELGVPFSDPVADGPVIQRASERALRNGTTLRDVLKLAGELRAQKRDAGIIIFSYL